MYFAAKVITSMIFSAIILGMLLLLGSTAGGLRMPFSNAIRLMATLVAGSLPFSAMGLALGYFTGPNSAPATINLIYLPMSFCSGLWVRFMFLPKILRQVALVLPPYQLSQLTLGVVGAGNHESAFTHWEVLMDELLRFHRQIAESSS